MPCYNPLDAYIKEIKDNGKKDIVFNKPHTDYLSDIKLPCGRCIGCKLSRSISWATRCMHESQLYMDNCFITLTYNDKNIPHDYSLNHSHFQKFMKRLRKDIYPNKVRYFMCGEYGDETNRPHYHAILFNYNFQDRVVYDESKNYSISSQLFRLWPLGNHIIAPATFETAAYVARYCTKKITGEMADKHYNRIVSDWNEVTGEINTWQEVQLEPEYGRMSTKPGIGKDWYKKFKSDCYPSDFVINTRGYKTPIPKYYDKLLEQEEPQVLKQLKFSRSLKQELNWKENTRYRLAQKKICKEKQLETLLRNRI